jgi:hypothetical protein
MVCIPDDIFHRGSGASIAAVQKIQLDQKMPTAQVIPCHDQQMTRRIIKWICRMM